jgi:hypothetical protein
VSGRPTFPSISAEAARVSPASRAGETLFRMIAVAFTNEAARKWTDRELGDTCRALVSSSYLTPRDAASGRLLVYEGSHPPVPIAIGERSPSDAGERDVRPMLRETVSRVVQALRGLTRRPQDDRFIQAAVARGRVVQQARADGVASWRPVLAEGEPLSEWMLALYAADALRGREDYDVRLRLCDACGFVAFGLLDGHACASGG